jgi:hypothetical protein
MFRNLIISVYQDIFVQIPIDLTSGYRIMRIPLTVTSSDPVIALESFKLNNDKPLGVGFLDPTNENIVFTFGKQDEWQPTARPMLSEYVLTFFNSGDLSLSTMYKFTSYSDFSYHQFDIKPWGTDFLVFMTSSGTPAQDTRAVYTMT